LHGRLVRDPQFFKFSKVRCLRTPMDGCTSYNLAHFSKISFSRFGASVKSGVSIKNGE